MTPTEKRLQARIDDLEMELEDLRASIGLPDENRIEVLRRKFGVTAMEAKMLQIIHTRPEGIPKQRLHSIMYAGLDYPPDDKIVGVRIHRLRKSLTPWGVVIHTPNLGNFRVTGLDEALAKETPDGISYTPVQQNVTEKTLGLLKTAEPCTTKLLAAGLGETIDTQRARMARLASRGLVHGYLTGKRPHRSLAWCLTDEGQKLLDQSRSDVRQDLPNLCVEHAA